MRFPLLLSLLLLCLTAAAAEAAGLRTFELPGGEGSPVLEGAIWTPCDRPPAAVRLRRIEVPAVPDCPTQGEDLPLVVISHGARGWYGGHHDTAAALADAGFVVTAVTHPEAAGRRWQRERPAAIERLIDYMLEEWPDRARLDPERIGFFGFSRGGYTGLVLLGGEPDFRRVLGHCREVPSDPLCAPSDARRAPQEATAAPAPAAAPFPHDPRIRAAVIAAPLGLVFPPEGLAAVTAPLQLWRAEEDELAIHPYNAEAVFRALPGEVDYRVVGGAGHFAFLAPCSDRQVAAAPAQCRDADGFDRAAFHQAFNAAVLAFFERTLSTARGSPQR